MKKFGPVTRLCSSLLLLLCLALLVGCGDRSRESQPATVPPKDQAAPANPSAAATDTDTPPAVQQFALQYTAGKNGTIKGASPQSVNEGGDGSPVTAVADKGYHFVDWSDGVTTASRTDRKVSADLVLTANFTVNQYTLTYTAADHGTLEGVSPQSVNHGSDGSPVTALASQGHHFTSWSDGITTASRTDTNITGDIAVKAGFAVSTFTVGGTVSGLAAGNDVVLQNNGGDDLSVSANGDFSFATPQPYGRAYTAKVLTQPTTPNQTCTVSNNAGTIGGANVTDIRVECRLNTYTISGMISGLPDGSQLVLRNNKGDDLTVGANGNFSFAKALPDGSPYEVTLNSQRLQPKWTCTVGNAVGTLAGDDVTNVEIACFPEVELRAVAGNRKIDLYWNSQDFSGATFNLCRAQEEIGSSDFSRCKELKQAAFETKVKSPFLIAKLFNETPYWLQIEVVLSNGRRTYSKIVTATPFGGLNDTGIEWCADNSTNRNVTGPRDNKTSGCEAVTATHPGQDGHHGRDAAARARKLSKTGSGQAGFDFTKVCMNGETAGQGGCPPNPSLGNGANNWACTLDNVTGLIWEVKTESGLRSKSSLYTWYNPNDAINGGDPGRQTGGNCSGSDCNTHAFVQAVNASGLCGAKDWRLPTKKELLSIVHNGRSKPAIDGGYFPNSLPTYYWSGSPYADQANSAWQVYFLYGEAYPNTKNQRGQVRLVRGAK